MVGLGACSKTDKAIDAKADTVEAEAKVLATDLKNQADSVKVAAEAEAEAMRK